MFITENKFFMNYQALNDCTINCVILGSASGATKQLIATNNTITASASGTDFGYNTNFIITQGDLIYSQICNNSYYTIIPGLTDLNSWLSFGTHLTTGTIIANNTHN